MGGRWCVCLDQRLRDLGEAGVQSLHAKGEGRYLARLLPQAEPLVSEGPWTGSAGSIFSWLDCSVRPRDRTNRRPQSKFNSFNASQTVQLNSGANGM